MTDSLDGLVGIYEKSLPQSAWPETLRLARRSGYDFLELSIDESESRIARLAWSQRERLAVRRDAERSGVRIGTLTLSAQRAYPMGSVDQLKRSTSADLATRAIGLAADLGATVVQIAGYFTFYEPAHPQARRNFLEGLGAAADLAATRGLSLGIENVDGHDVTKVADGIDLIRSLGRSNVGLYVDVGNIVGNGGSVTDELIEAGPYMIALQLKDARLGEFRRVRFGEGGVDFSAVFQTLNGMDYRGPVSVEMWNDDGDIEMAAEALRYLKHVGLDQRM